MEFSEKHAEFVGLHFGDGSLIKRKDTDRLRFQLRGDAKADREHYESFIIPLCNELIGFPLRGRPVPTVHDKKLNSFGVYFEGEKLHGFFNALKINPGVKEELPIPDWIKNNQSFSIAFLRGLFDTDGNIYYKRNNNSKSLLNVVGIVSITTTSKALSEDVSVLLSTLEIKHYVEHRKPIHKQKKDYYKIQVYRPHHRKFMALIGTHNPKHLTKFEMGEKFGFCPPRTTLEQRKQILKGELSPFFL